MAKVIDRDEMLNELAAEAENAQRHGARNNIVDMCLTMGTVLSSFAASVLIAANRVDPMVTAAVAALPVVFSSAQVKVNPKARSSWYFRTGARLLDLKYRLESAKNPDLSSYGIEHGRIETESTSEWIQSIGTGSAPTAMPSIATDELPHTPSPKPPSPPA